MGNSYENEPIVSPEQEKKSMLLSELSSKFQELIDEKRNKALEKLLEESCSEAVKTIELNDYFSFRMAPDEYSVQGTNGVTYFLPQMIQIAQLLYDDRTFNYSDSSLVLDNLDFFNESINYIDIVLAYHYYRLSKDDVSLSHLVKLIGYYAKYAFKMDGLRINFPVSDYSLSHDESIKHLDSIIMFVDSYLQRYGEERKLFYGKYELKKEARISFSSRIDNNAMQSFMKKSPLYIRKSKLTDFLSKYGNFDEFYLSWLLDELYAQIVITQETKYEELASVQWPTFADLLFLAEKEYSQEKQSGEYSNKAYKHIIDVLNHIYNRSMVSEFNVQIAITEEDFIESENTNRKMDTESAFNNIRRNIRFLFVVNMAAETIPEFSADTTKIKWRKSICRKLCDIFADECAYESITDEDEINITKIFNNERNTETKKNELFKSFLMLSDLSSIESIMEKRLELLDRAKSIAPEDFAFLEKCSADILDKLQKSMQDDDLSPFAEKLRIELNSGKRIQLPEKVILTLATADFLFDRYVTEHFANQGFDYSSISALYYQAFECAYNELIWGKYANYLNKILEIDGDKYITILTRKHDKGGIFHPDDPGYGFLPPNENNKKLGWKHFTHHIKNVKMTYVNTTCMYSPFAKFIKPDEKQMSELSGFYEWFAQEFGFGNRENMLEGGNFKRLLKQFQLDMDAAVVNRNNASHGEISISKSQCNEDKKIVLNNVKTIRIDYLGLIWQLLNLLNMEK